MLSSTQHGRLIQARARSVAVLLAALALCGAGCGDDGDDDAAAQIQQGTIISLGDGRVQGDIDGGTRRFLGIPFAAPPVGDLRWRPPAPPIPWQGVREAKLFSAGCPQGPSLQGTASEEEDCLYLNVWTPEPAPAQPLPVMVWFHGGSNQTGSTGDQVPFGIGGPLYNGRALAETRDVIVVTTNYRLNVFGFFAHSALAAEDPTHPYAGNQGLLDQRAALEWVQKNIRAFGGDPDNVTIFGESAGSFDVCFHVVSPKSRGLFHRAISESGGCTTRQPTAAEAEAEAERLITAVGCAGTNDILACLRQVPVADLLDASGFGPIVGGDSLPDGLGPIVDGDFLPDQPRALFASGDFAKVPYILGSNADEGTIFFLGVPPVETDEEYLAALHAQYGDLAEQVADLYPPGQFPSQQDALVRAFGDAVLVCPTYDSARRAAAGGADVHLYNFARPVSIPELAPLKLGALHGIEIAYVFGSVQVPNPTDQALALAMQGYWSRFARHGNPNGEGALVWPRYEDASDQRLNFDAEISVLTGFRRTECEFWWDTYDAEF